MNWEDHISRVRAKAKRVSVKYHQNVIHRYGIRIYTGTFKTVEVLLVEGNEFPSKTK